MRPQNLNIGKRKVAIIGVGFVGASIAYALTIRNLAREIVLIDIDKKKAEGEALDIQHGIPYMGMSAVYAGDYSDARDCDLIIITAGRNRKIGESRNDLVLDNSRIIKNVVESIGPFYTHGVILLVSNPVDLLVSLCDSWMGLPRGRVFGTGCILDSSRFVSSVADYVGLNTEVIKGTVVGEHGDFQIPVWSRLSIAGMPIEEYCNAVNLLWGEKEKEAIANRVRTMGATIIANKGKTHYGIATCVCLIADAVLNQRLTIASVSSPLDGEYGISGVSMSLPSIIGVNGVEQQIEEKWNEEERQKFMKSADKIKRVLEGVRL